MAFKIREHADPVAQLGGAKKRTTRPSPAEPIPPETLELIRQMQSEHYRRWLDNEIPALGGLSPREAAKRKGEPRRKLKVLLAENEHAEAGQPAEARFDVSALRRELGLE